MSYVPVFRIPILLECIDADFATWLSYIRMENLSQEVTFWWLLRELSIYSQSAPEYAIMERRVHYKVK